jgi:hypothetical protein
MLVQHGIDVVEVRDARRLVDDGTKLALELLESDVGIADFLVSDVVFIDMV